MHAPRPLPLSWLAAAAALLISSTLHAQPDRSNGFDADAENWRSSAAAVTPTWQATGGAAGAFLQLTGSGGPLAFVSPAAWAGNWSGYRALKFDLSIPSRHYPAADRADLVTIVGANGQMMSWNGPTPIYTWSRYEISLDAASFGVDQATFDAIMADVVEVRILAEFTPGANESVGLDNVLLTSAPVVVQTSDLIERFTHATKTGTTVGGWRPVDDVTLTAVDAGQPLFALHGNDHRDGRLFRVATPESWAGDWRGFTRMAMDYKWQSNGGTVGGADMVRIFGANGAMLSWSTALVAAQWQKLVIPLEAVSFGVDEEAFQAVMKYVTHVEIRGEFNSGDDLLWLDNVEITAAPLVVPVFDSSLVSRFGADAEGWRVFESGTLAWSPAGGFGGAAITATDTGTGIAKFASPDAWSGDWRAFTTLRFLLKPLGNSRPTGPLPVVIYGSGGATLTATVPPPYLSWTPYTLDLTPETFGVSVAEFEAVLQNVAYLAISGDLVDGSDTTALDDVSLLIAGAALPAPPEMVSTFDDGIEGWRKGGTSGTAWGLLAAPPAHRTDGNPGGSIAVTDDYSITYWLTPEKTAGDWRGYQSISFDLKIITGTTLLVPGAMLGIVSAHGELIQSVSAAPVPGQWNHYEFALNPTAFGVTPEEFEKIMRDVVMLGIRAEWINGAELEALDNVRISKAPEAYWLWLAGYLDAAELNDESIAGKLADADGDGVANYHEFLALTVPTDPLSRFTASARSPAGGGVAIDFLTRAGREYQVWRSDSLANWLPAGPVISGDDTLKTHSDPAAGPKAFFRVEVSIP